MAKTFSVSFAEDVEWETDYTNTGRKFIADKGRLVLYDFGSTKFTVSSSKVKLSSLPLGTQISVDDNDSQYERSHYVKTVIPHALYKGITEIYPELVNNRVGYWQCIDGGWTPEDVLQKMDFEVLYVPEGSGV